MDHCGPDHSGPQCETFRCEILHKCGRNLCLYNAVECVCMSERVTLDSRMHVGVVYEDICEDIFQKEMPQVDF